MKFVRSLFSLCLAFLSQTTFAISAGHPLTIMTLNLANYNDHIFWEQRLQLIADTIQKSNADIIALQETRYDPDHASSSASHQDMAQQILYQLHLRGEYLEAQLVTQPIMYYPYGVNEKLGAHNYPLPAALAFDKQTYYWEGISIISKLPIIETGSIFLSKLEGCADNNKRATQYIKVNNQGEDFYIANIHFSGQQCFATQMRETITYLNSYMQNKNLFILGDFNATPDNVAFQQLTTLGLVDLWAKLQPNENGYTTTAENPTRRIDYIWASSPLASVFTTPNQIQIIANQPRDGIFPSDHLGLVATMQIEK